MAITLTQEQFKQRYGQEGLDAFKSPAEINTPQEKPGFFSRAGTALKERFGEVKKTFGETARGEISPVETGVRLVGDVAGGVGDVVGAALSPQVEKLAQKEWAKPAFEALAGGMEKYEEWKNSSELNRRTAEVLEGVVNIADLLGAAKGGALVTKTARQAAETGIKSVAKTTEQAFEQLKNIKIPKKGAIREVIPTAEKAIEDNVVKAFRLAPSDVTNLELSTGQKVGQWLIDKDLIKNNFDDTVVAVKKFGDEQYSSVRNEIAKVEKLYSQTDLPRYTDTLDEIRDLVSNVKGLETDAKLVNDLLNKKTITLSDYQKAKELLDKYENVYKTTGEIKGGATPQGIASMRKEMKQFIEKEVMDTTGADIGLMNNNVSVAKTLYRDNLKRAPKGLTKQNITLKDVGLFGIPTAFGSPLTGFALLFAKKLIETPSAKLKFAKWANALAKRQKNKIIEDLSKGIIPKEIPDEFTRGLDTFIDYIGAGTAISTVESIEGEITR